MADKVRLNVTIDAEQFAKLSAMAERAHLKEGTLARSLLSTAIDLAETSGAEMTRILSQIDGALDSAERGTRDVDAGRTVSLDDFRK